jgi:hypothetical protein
VDNTFRRDWVTRLAGDMVKPFVSSNLGVPPVFAISHEYEHHRTEDLPTVNNNTSTLSSPSPLAASAHAFLTSSFINASPLNSLACPLLTYFWMVVSASKVEGERRRNVTVAPFSGKLQGNC